MGDSFPGWHKPSPRTAAPSFCLYSRDWDGGGGRVVFLIDPDQARAFWVKHGFAEMVAWADSGFDGPKQSESSPESIWILSPDIGKGG